jgi:hypothetical protein
MLAIIGPHNKFPVATRLQVGDIMTFDLTAKTLKIVRPSLLVGANLYFFTEEGAGGIDDKRFIPNLGDAQKCYALAKLVAELCGLEIAFKDKNGRPHEGCVDIIIKGQGEE